MIISKIDEFGFTRLKNRGEIQMDRMLTGAIAFVAGAAACHLARENDMMFLSKRDMKKIQRKISRMMW